MISIQGGIGETFILPVKTSGNPPSPAFPQRMLSIADLEIQVKGKNVSLEGQNQWPDDVMPSDKEGSIKLTVGRIGIDFYNLAFGETVASGYTLPILGEGPYAIPATPFQVTVTGAATFVDDLAVYNTATGQQLQQVASGPTAGQYSFAAGVYTFASADHVSGVSVRISYTTGVTGSGRTLSIGNHGQGFGPINRLVSVCPYTCPAATSPLGAINVRSVRLTSVGIPFKRNGYVMMPLEGTIFPDGSGVAVDIWSPQ